MVFVRRLFCSLEFFILLNLSASVIEIAFESTDSDIAIDVVLSTGSPRQTVDGVEDHVCSEDGESD